jgi:general secretion pathway protein C
MLSFVLALATAAGCAGDRPPASKASATPPAAASPAAAPPVRALVAPDAPPAPLAPLPDYAGDIRRVDATTSEITRGLIGRILAEPASFRGQARLVPSIKDGRKNGFKLYAIRERSVYALLGFEAGDTIHAINGFEMTTPDAIMDAYARIRDAGEWRVAMTRRGEPRTMVIRTVDAFAR